MSVQTTQSGATDDWPVLDLGKLDAFETEAGASPNNSLERVLRQFFRSAPNLLAEMENDHAGEDNAGLARSAQLLAANSDAVGAVCLAHKCRTLESQANTGKVDAELVGAIAFDYDDAACALEDELSRRAPSNNAEAL